MRIAFVIGAAFLLLSAAFLPGATTAPAAPSTVPATRPDPIPSTVLKIDIEGGKSITLSPQDLAKLPHEKVPATDHDGTATNYSGVPLAALLAQVDAPLGDDKLRGQAMTLYLVAEGTDGYKVIFSLAELDPGFAERHIIVADQRAGQPLTRTGAFQLIAPEDKRQGRWVRNLTALHLRRTN